MGNNPSHSHKRENPWTIQVMKCKRSTILEKIMKAYKQVLPDYSCKDNNCWLFCKDMLDILGNPRGWTIKIVGGFYKKQGHYWLQLDDGTIVDPTQEQFGGMEIYIGPSTSDYVLVDGTYPQ